MISGVVCNRVSVNMNNGDYEVLVSTSTASSLDEKISNYKKAIDIYPMRTDAYFKMICNDFDKNIENALISPECNLKYAVNEYIEHLPHYDQLNCSDFINYSGFQKLAYLFL